MRRVTKEQFNQLRNFYKDVKYRIVKDGSTYKLYAPAGEYYYIDIDGDGGFPINQLSFIPKVKRSIIIPKKNYKAESEIKYFSYADLKAGTKLKNCFALDIKNAYWQAAFNEGTIRKDIFEEGQLKDKRIRLASLGSFAKARYDYTIYKGRESFDGEHKPEHSHVFFNQANTISKIMAKCRTEANGSFIIGWVDMIVCRTDKALNKCAEIIADNGFNYKTYIVNSIERTPTGIVFDNNTPDSKPFYLPNNQ